MISELCLFDLSEGVSVLLAHDGHIEAPNWHPDGYLIVNGGGRLFRVPLDAPALIPIDTGTAVRCNNDHGISPDGRTLVISDSSVTDGSCIYTLPIGGGTPARVTEQVPSWWHGWSPDGTRLTYVAARDGGPILPYTCALDGSDERLLVGGFDHVDGPDYTPDGNWIWFNGERDGQVDLWRVHPDGTGLERMTDGPTVDWFPHPSPDGRHVLLLAYPKGTKGHPANLDVALCLMPAAGGPGRELIRFTGGQGSINVPCWSPQSDRFAFVRYRL
ncbi:TolB family protein [Marivivens marinus]|uniref:TolB family protein n=1 Tax=Marivivens marinus TaxID=3110173 RepID=UPI003B846C62